MVSVANSSDVALVMNYLAKKRGYSVIAYKPGSRNVPQIGSLIQEFSAHPIKKLLRVRRVTDKADWDRQFSIAKKRFPRILWNPTTEADDWPNGTFLRASFGRRSATRKRLAGQRTHPIGSKFGE